MSGSGQMVLTVSVWSPTHPSDGLFRCMQLELDMAETLVVAMTKSSLDWS